MAALRQAPSNNNSVFIRKSASVFASFPLSPHHGVPDAKHDDASVRQNTGPVVASRQPA